MIRLSSDNDNSSDIGSVVLEKEPELNFDQDVILSINKPFKKDSHIKILYGNLAPKGAVAKISTHETYF